MQRSTAPHCPEPRGGPELEAASFLTGSHRARRGPAPLTPHCGPVSPAVTPEMDGVCCPENRVESQAATERRGTRHLSVSEARRGAGGGSRAAFMWLRVSAWGTPVSGDRDRAVLRWEAGLHATDPGPPLSVLQVHGSRGPREARNKLSLLNTHVGLAQPEADVPASTFWKSSCYNSGTPGWASVPGKSKTGFPRG